MSVQLLAIAYAFVAALLLNVWIATRWSTAFKITMLVLVSVLYIGSYMGMREVQGWPTQDEIPASFRLIWAKIDEPDKDAGTDGQIYLWVQDIDITQRITSEPRAYKLPYELALAEEVAQAMQQTEAGVLLNGKMTRGMLKPKSEEDPTAMAQQMEDSAESDVTGTSNDRIHLEFTELPKSPLPAKST
jgi:hypothetical protein